MSTIRTITNRIDRDPYQHERKVQQVISTLEDEGYTIADAGSTLAIDTHGHRYVTTTILARKEGAT